MKILIPILLIVCIGLTMPEIEPVEEITKYESPTEITYVLPINIEEETQEEPTTKQIDTIHLPEIEVLYSDKDKDTIARVVYAEARGECEDGQIAVAQVVMNRYESGRFGKTLEHITRRSQFAKASAKVRDTKAYAACLEAVERAIEERPLPDNTYFFCRGKEFYGEFYCQIGAHCFFVD